MAPVLPCFPYMVMLPNHLDVKSIVLDRALLWALLCGEGRYFVVRVIRPLLFHGIRADLSGSSDYLLDFKAIGCIFPWNNSMCVIGLGTVLGVFNQYYGLWTSDTL